MSEERHYKQIDVELEIHKGGGISIHCIASDGSALSAQEIIDAVSEVLIYEYGTSDKDYKPEFDA